MRIQAATTPNSVRAGVFLGFGFLIVMLAVIVGGAVFTVRNYQSSTSEMQKRAALSSELQETEANASVSALLIQRYVLVGDATLVTEIQLSAVAAVQALERASALAAETDSPLDNTYETLSTMAATSAEMTGATSDVIALRQGGDIESASAAMESIVPKFREFRLQLITLADAELAAVSRLQAKAASDGDLALSLLMVSGAVGSVLAFAVAFMVIRSIVRPLSNLEDTALAVALGDTRARAPVEGPRELKRLAESLNLMTSTAHQRTEELRLSNEELRQRNRQLLDARYQATTDPLTGLLNHRSFHERIKSVVTDCLREGKPATAIMIDIDNFKRVNDSLGHMAGDHVLREIGATICDVVGDQNAYRYGGDEFTILLPGVGRSEAFNVADRILKAVRTRVRSEDGDKATVSVGIACFPDWAGSSEELLYRADMALNWAKSRGKNRVAGWDQVSEAVGVAVASDNTMATSGT